MKKAEELFHKITSELPGTEEGNMFGSLCIKAPNGKAIAMLWKNYMIFKLGGQAGEEALSLNGARIGVHLYDPDRPMKGWVQIPFKHSAQWEKYTKIALENIRTCN